MADRGSSLRQPSQLFCPNHAPAAHCYIEAPLDLFRCDFADTTAVSAVQRSGERMTAQVRTRCPRRALPRSGGAASGAQRERRECVIEGVEARRNEVTESNKQGRDEEERN